MTVTDALNSRFTCRAFKPDPVNKETILKIIESATQAPSWENTQPWEVFIASGDTLARIRQSFLNNFEKEVSFNPDLPVPKEWPDALKARGQQLAVKRFEALGIERDDKEARRDNIERNLNFFGAPVVIYLCMDRTLTPWSIFDMGSLSQSIMLTAQEYGLDTAPAVMLVAYPESIRAEIGISEELLIIFGIALGYGDADHPQNKVQSPRRVVEEVVRFKG